MRRYENNVANDICNNFDDILISAFERRRVMYQFPVIIKNKSGKRK